jgi:hypothetical protein
MRRIVPTLALAVALAAGESDLRLMGYGSLDPQGRPQQVVVALTRQRFDALCAQSGDAPVPSLGEAGLAIGPPVVTLTLAGSTVEGRMELPFAVPGDGWRELRLPMPGAISRLEVKPGRSAWETVDDHLVLRLEGRQQGTIMIGFSIQPVQSPGGWRLDLPAMSGGRLRLVAPAPWRAVFADQVLADGQTDLPADGRITVGWDLPSDAVVSDGRLSVGQDIGLRLLPGHVAWSDQLDLSSAGAGLGGLRVQLPTGLVLTEVTGEDLAGWRSRPGEVQLTWSSPASARHVLLSGIIARSGGAGQADVALRVPGAAVSRGRIGLAPAPGERFVRPDVVGLSSAQPADGEALAMRWNDQPDQVPVTWESAPRGLVLARDIAVVLAEGRVRAAVHLVLGGRGSSENLRLSLAEPWRVVAVDGASWAFQGVGEARQLVLSSAQPWTSGAQALVRLEADRALLGDRPHVPVLESSGADLVAGRLRIALADAGATRSRLDAADARLLAPAVLAQELGSVSLRPGERWRSAAELPGDARPVLRLEADVPQASARLSHYLILGRDNVRWSLHIDLTPEQGALGAVGLRLPPNARLVSVDGLGLGRWRVEDGLLRLNWVSPVTAPASIDLELDQPIGADGLAQLIAPQLDGVRSEQQIALVEDDDLGLVKRDVDGLGELEQPIARLPAGVDRAQVRWLWKAARADWSLRLSREALVATAGADGLATLVDGSVTAAPDGELRGSATWHVVNRTRQHLPLRIPAGVELWEARVDGRAVRVRRDASGGSWLPVPPLRPGQATTRVTLVWAARPSATGLRLDPPILGELKVITSVWRLSAPDGWSLTRSGGSLQESDPVDAAAERAQAVIDEIQRLQAVDGLNEAGLKRLEGQLAVLDSELKDHLVTLGQRSGELRGAASASAAWLSKVASTTDAISSNSQRLNEIQQEITVNFGNRSSRRQKLNLGALNQDWGRAGGNAPITQPIRPMGAMDEPLRRVLQYWPWDEALPPAAGQSLGQGLAPPGLAAAASTALSGIELVDGAARPVLVLRGQGGGLDADLRLVRGQGDVQPWLLAVLSLLVLTVGSCFGLRRKGRSEQS